MNMLKKGLLPLLALLFFAPLGVVAQNNYAEKADALFEQKRYLEAIDKYEDAYKKVKDNKAEKNRIYFQIGECYRLVHYYNKAEVVYKQLVASKYYKTEPIIYFHLAEVCRFNGHFDDAEQNYKEYLKIVPDDKLAKSRLESLDYVRWLVHDRTRHTIRKLTQWSTQWNDWAPRFLGDDTNTITFSSSRYGAGTPEGASGSTDAWTGQAFSEIYYVFRDRKGNWSQEPELFETEGHINTSVNEGEAVFSPDGRTVWFSRCDVRKNKTEGCYIYTATRNNNTLDKKKSKKKAATENQPSGEWGASVRVDLGDTAFNYLYPAVTRDGLTMYFSSDMPGGQGDYDIWMVTRKSTSDEFSNPVNLGRKINTGGREGFPVLRNDSVMYYSSNGLPGIGGYDLFRTELEGRRWSEPENLGVPLNSSYDEMSIVFYPDENNIKYEERGYFSSNRPFDDPHSKDTQKKGQKIPPINDDLYAFELEPLLYSIQGTVRDEKSMQLVQKAKVKLVGSNGTEYETYTDKKGFYRFDVDKVKRNVVYKMYVSKVDYFTTEGSESTKGYNVSKDLVHDFRLEPVPKMPVVLPEIRYDLAKWDLKEEFMDSLMDLYLIMVNNPNVVVEIRAHTDCRPFIGLTNDTLSQRRAQSVVDYLISRGIERERLVPKGYAERVPRTLDRNMTIKVNGKKHSFSKGTVLECDYVNSIKEVDRREAAHQLNRRIEFLVLRTDFVSKRLIDNMQSDQPQVKYTDDGHVIDLVNAPIEEGNPEPDIIHDEGTIPVTMIHSAKGEISCIINGSAMPMLIDERSVEPIAISWEEAMNFLYQRRITKEDFPDRDNAFDPEGNILDKSTIIFKEMKIGEKVVHNVEVVVVKGVDYKFIVNREGLNMFGKYEFDKQRGKLYFVD